MSDRSSFIVIIARYIQKFPLWIFQFIEWPFIIKSEKNNNTPAIIIFALPRSGSTVMYQSICHGLKVNYLSNLWNLFYQLPLLGGWLSAKKARNHHSDFHSQYGFVPGLDGPAEGLRFWKWWLDCGLTDPHCHTMPARTRKNRSAYLQKVLSFFAQQNLPFATTYLGHTLVPDRVAQTFPGAVLIRLRRDPVTNALSLLKSIRANHSQWFSVKPKECEALQSATEHERAAAQVYWLNRRLDNAACAKTIHTIHYEQLCENPEKTIECIRFWCTENGIPVERKFPLPQSFSYKKAEFHADPDTIKIQDALERLEKQYGELEKIP